MTPDEIKVVLAKEAENNFDAEVLGKDLTATAEDDGSLVLTNPHVPDLHQKTRMTTWARSQYLNRCGVRVDFYNKCPKYLQQQIVDHFGHNRQRDFLLRCRKGQDSFIRGVVTPTFSRERDDQFLYPVALDAVKDQNALVRHFLRSETTSELLVRFEDTAIVTDDVKIAGGLSISNSEVGQSSVWIEPVVLFMGNKHDSHFGELDVRNRSGGRSEMARRFVHRGHRITLDDIGKAIQESKDIAQVGITQYLERAKEFVTAKEATAFMNEIPGFPSRWANLFSEDFEKCGTVSRQDVLMKILRVAKDLPLIQSMQVKREAGRFINLFENWQMQYAELHEAAKG